MFFLILRGLYGMFLKNGRVLISASFELFFFFGKDFKLVEEVYSQGT